LTGDVNDVDTPPQPSLQQVGVKENIKENKEETPQNMPLEWYIQHDLPVPEHLTELAQLQQAATAEFEAALGFSQLPWDSTREWQSFKTWVVKIYQSSPADFKGYAEWRKAGGKYDAMSNKQIRLKPEAFKDTAYPTYKAAVNMEKPANSESDYRPRISA
jgi:hypothetical protein